MTKTNTLLKVPKLLALSRQIRTTPRFPSLPTSLALQHFLGCCLRSNQAFQKTYCFPSVRLPSPSLFSGGLSQVGVCVCVCFFFNEGVWVWLSSITKVKEVWKREDGGRMGVMEKKKTYGGGILAWMSDDTFFQMHEGKSGGYSVELGLGVCLERSLQIQQFAVKNHNEAQPFVAPSSESSPRRPSYNVPKLFSILLQPLSLQVPIIISLINLPDSYIQTSLRLWVRRESAEVLYVGAGYEGERWLVGGDRLTAAHWAFVHVVGRSIIAWF